MGNYIKQIEGTSLIKRSSRQLYRLALIKYLQNLQSIISDRGLDGPVGDGGVGLGDEGGHVPERDLDLSKMLLNFFRRNVTFGVISQSVLLVKPCLIFRVRVESDTHRCRIQVSSYFTGGQKPTHLRSVFTLWLSIFSHQCSTMRR